VQEVRAHVLQAPRSDASQVAASTSPGTSDARSGGRGTVDELIDRMTAFEREMDNKPSPRPDADVKQVPLAPDAPALSPVREAGPSEVAEKPPSLSASPGTADRQPHRRKLGSTAVKVLVGIGLTAALAGGLSLLASYLLPHTALVSGRAE